MAVRFVIGRAGSGKTRHCFDAIVAAMRAEPLGPPIYWILPKQATFQAERELTTLSGLGAFCRARVLSFELLGEEVLAACGGAAVPEVSAIGRQMLIGHLLRSKQDELQFFRGVARQPGLAARLDATFAEFERCGKDPAALAEVIEQLGGEGDRDDASKPADIESAPLRRKLSDFHRLFTAYRDALGNERVDPHRRLEQVLACIADHAPLRGAAVYIDGFYDFTDRERRMVVALAQSSAAVEITILIDPTSPTVADIHHLPDELSLFHRTETQYRLLRLAIEEAGIRVEPNLALREPRRFKTDTTLVIERYLMGTELPARQTVAAPRAMRPTTTPGPPHGQSRTGKRANKAAPVQPGLFDGLAAPAVARDDLRAVGGQADLGDNGDRAGSADAPAMIEAPDRRTEVDAVARRIRSAVIGTGNRLRFRDIAVLVRDIDDYEPLIDASFREHGIPYFVDRRRSASHHPLIQFTRAAFQIARQNWPHEAVMGLLKSGLSGIRAEAVDRLENYVLLHRLRGGDAWESPEPWKFNRSQRTRRRDDSDVVIEQRTESAEMDELRRHLATRFQPFLATLHGAGQTPTHEPTVRAIVVALFTLFSAFDVRTTLAGWIADADAANDPVQRGEHEQVWAELVKLFDQMVDLLGDQPVGLADFLEILDVGLEQFDLALPPARVDQVLIGQVDRTRTPPLDTVFLLGLSEGQFPKVAREDSVLSDGDRRALRDRRLNIDPDSERKLLDENFFAYVAFSRASRTLVVTRPASEESKPTNPSSYWSRLARMFGDPPITRQKRESEAGPEAIGTPRQLVTALMRWARQDKPGTDREQPYASLYQFLAGHTAYDDAIGVMRYKAWRAIDYSNDATLSAETAELLVPGPLQASVTRIETFATCPFKHYARYALGLSVREEEDVTAMDLGNVYHSILERIVTRMLHERADWCEIEPRVTGRMISEYAEEVGRALRGELMLSTARNQYLLERIARTLERVCATQRAVLSRGDFRPAAAELSFGFEKSMLPPLQILTPSGRKVLLSGKIDRVDKSQSGDEVAVIDYKMPGRKLQLDHVYYGLSLQLLTYLLVLQASGDKIFQTKVKPVAAFYSKLLRSLESIDHPGEAKEPDDPLFDLQKPSKPRGIFDERIIPSLDREVDCGASAAFAFTVRKDGTLGSPDRSDAADASAFAALLKFVEKCIAELADDLIAGSIEARPYRMGTTTPCPHCDFRSVCRFDPGLNPYRNVQSLPRSEVLARVMREHGGTVNEQ